MKTKIKFSLTAVILLSFSNLNFGQISNLETASCFVSKTTNAVYNNFETTSLIGGIVTPSKTVTEFFSETVVEQKVDLATNDKDTITNETELDPIITLNAIFSFKNILFPFGDRHLTNADMQILDKVIKVLIKNPTIVIELCAYTDARGNNDVNLKLSQNRAQSTIFYLLSKGVQTNQLIATGYGEGNLKNKCGNGVICSEHDHAVNRRVEIRVVKTN